MANAFRRLIDVELTRELRGLRAQGAVIRTLLDELDRISQQAKEDRELQPWEAVRRQLSEEILRLGSLISDCAGAMRREGLARFTDGVPASSTPDRE